MKKNVRIIYIGIFCASTFLSCRKEMLGDLPGGTSYNRNKEDRSFIIIAKEGENLATISEKLTAIGARKFKIKSSLEELGLITVVTPDPSFPAKARQITGIESVAVNLTMNFRIPTKVKVSKIKSQKHAPSVKPVTDPLKVLQWGLKSIKVQEAWNKGYNGKGAVVAVLDGGFFLDEPEIAQSIIATRSFVDGESVQFQGNGFSHGTHVAGIIAAASDGYGTVGAAHKSRLILGKVLGDDGFGTYESIISGILYAANKKADVINMSLGGYLPTHSYTDDNGTPDDPSDDYFVDYSRDIKPLISAMNRATIFANLKGSVVIAAAGNDAVNLTDLPDYNMYPAQCIGVLAIAANGPLGWGYNQDTNLYKPSAFTNYGKSVIAFGAPGGNYDPNAPFDATLVDVYGYVDYAEYFNYVLSTGYYENGEFYYIWAVGTSMAAPYASAVAAIICGKYNGNILPLFTELIMAKSADDYGAPGKDKFFGYGQVNAGKAIKY